MQQTKTAQELVAAIETAFASIAIAHDKSDEPADSHSAGYAKGFAKCLEILRKRVERLELEAPPDRETIKQIPLNDDTKFILGMMVYQSVPIARALLAMGHDIPKKTELEQAHALHWLLNIYLEHGDNWKAECERILKSAAESPRG